MSEKSMSRRARFLSENGKGGGGNPLRKMWMKCGFKLIICGATAVFFFSLFVSFA